MKRKDYRLIIDILKSTAYIIKNDIKQLPNDSLEAIGYYHELLKKIIIEKFTIDNRMFEVEKFLKEYNQDKR